jgi:NIMA-interacting peptidyl-prolyl cis-trans isomerase 1
MPIQCSHILQKHSGSRRPFDSFRNKPVTRSLNEARQNINSFLAQVKENPQSFSELALKYSECSSAARGGDLG